MTIRKDGPSPVMLGFVILAFNLQANIFRKREAKDKAFCAEACARAS